MSSALRRMRAMDWRIFLGLFITLIWVAGGVWYLQSSAFSFATLGETPLSEIGSFLEGAFAPLAFLWLVIGLFVQQKELADNTEVLRQTSIQSEKQTQAIAATEMNARQGTFFKIADSVRRQLGGISGMLFISSFGASEGQLYSKEKLDEMWHKLTTGDEQVFSREFLLINADDYGGYKDLFHKTEIRRKHTENFLKSFDRLLEMAANCDTTSGIIQDSLIHSAHGLLYQRMKDSEVQV